MPVVGAKDFSPLVDMGGRPPPAYHCPIASAISFFKLFVQDHFLYRVEPAALRGSNRRVVGFADVADDNLYVMGEAGDQAPVVMGIDKQDVERVAAL